MKQPRPTKPQPLTVKVIAEGKIHDGKGGCFPVGTVIVVNEAQAASLKAAGYAE